MDDLVRRRHIGGPLRSLTTRVQNAMRHAFTLRQMEGFLLAAELKSFSRAAEAMRITQSAFSQLIRELENSLGVRLFDRTTRHVNLTAAGEAMAKRMGGAIDVIDDACEEARAIARIESGHLTMGTLSSLAAGLVTRALGQMRRAFPGVSVTLQEAGNDEIVSRVDRGALDLAVCAWIEDAPSLSFQPLFDDELVVLLPLDHPKASASQLLWADLEQDGLVLPLRLSSTYRAISEAIRTHGVSIKVEYEMATLSTGLSMVRNGFGLLFVSRIITQEMNMEGLRALRIEEPPVRKIGVYRRADRSPSPAAVKFEELLRSEVAIAQRRLLSP